MDWGVWNGTGTSKVCSRVQSGFDSCPTSVSTRQPLEHSEVEPGSHEVFACRKKLDGREREREREGGQRAGH